VAQESSEGVPSKAELRRQLQEVDLYNANSIPEYLRRISEVEQLMPKIDQAYLVVDRYFASAEKKYANNPKTLRALRAYEKLNGYDKEGLLILKDEIRKAKWLAELPPDKQQAYFDSEVAPLRAKQVEIGRKEVDFARQMKAMGLLLPTDVAKSLK